MTDKLICSKCVGLCGCVVVKPKSLFFIDFSFDFDFFSLVMLFGFNFERHGKIEEMKGFAEKIFFRLGSFFFFRNAGMKYFIYI